MEELIEAYGWERIETKNPHMTSFIKDDRRMNYYKTGTVTVQNTNLKYDKGKTYREIDTERKMEELLKELD